ncbi:hypothetical protein PC116_g13255 [Phytophthora cactorum]|uniref:Uncharacterized protein n=1 Tax=Phytophthora cactorum TaxID=29920 RepID=A0A8T0Z7L2_9STRA|nr:hypothetical protein Pcac1_g9288 [Phytophthora cactorum]KAG2825221.1 hypothetical protein PC112_g9780 [Phytophthora cactorum]KAG2858134.1 hypothetical protein PC113_g10068 [Phytophthora cactorum]KAG3085940.1 hypothetical protein PC122_g9453 [Phytophthora cactorum]KAG4238714.1 hypothetical protein PC116_g13255 [Phytophthora cactorum]
MPIVPSNGASVLYNSYAKFHNGDSEFKYTLVDGSSYLTTTDAFDAETVRCIPPNTLLFDEILPALNNATPIRSASIGDKSVECESGTYSRRHLLEVTALFVRRVRLFSPRSVVIWTLLWNI